MCSRSRLNQIRQTPLNKRAETLADVPIDAPCADDFLTYWCDARQAWVSPEDWHAVHGTHEDASREPAK